MTIYLDFDGTVVEHKFPYMGKYNEGCNEVLKKLQEAGHKVILNSYRVNVNSEYLIEALDYLSELGIQVESVPSKMEPLLWNWEAFKERDIVFIDDVCPGIPLRSTVEASNGLMIDWKIIDKQCKENKLY